MKKIIHILLLCAFVPVLVVAQGAGTLDSTYGGTGIVYHKIDFTKTSFQRIKLQPDGKSLVFGYKAPEALSERRTTVTRFNTDGTIDASFGFNGNCVVDAFSAQGLDGHVLPDGSIIASSTGFYPNSVEFAKILPNGMLDYTFGNGGVVSNFQDVLGPNLKRTFLLPDNKIVAIGEQYDLAAQGDRGFVGRYLPNGRPDSTFGTFGIVKIEELNAQLMNRTLGGGIQPDGKIVITGSVGLKNMPETDDWLIIRLNANGSLDQGFGNGGKVRISLGLDYSEACYSVVFLPDGKLLVGGYAQKNPGYHFTIARFNNDGSLDPTYGFSGKTQIGMNCCFSVIFDMKQQADGKTVACGYSSDGFGASEFAVARFKPNGAIDQGFGSSGRVVLTFQPDTSQLASSLVIQNDNKILIAGYNKQVVDYEGIGVVVRLNPGTVTVGTDIPENTGIDEILLQPNPVAGNTLELKYTLQTTSPITMDLYDLTGRKISTIFEKETRFEGDNQESVQLPAGLPQGQYYLRMMTETGFVTMKFVKL